MVLNGQETHCLVMLFMNGYIDMIKNGFWLPMKKTN